MRINNDPQINTTELTEQPIAIPERQQNIEAAMLAQVPSQLEPAGAHQSAGIRRAEAGISASLIVGELKARKTVDNNVKNSTRLLSDPKAAIDFVNSFNKRLNLTSEDLTGKNAKMAESAHAFFRAMPALFFRDINSSFAIKSTLLNRPAPRITINGDIHLENLGTFRGPDGKAVWGMNDYDQAEVGSPEWDLARLSTSAILVARQMNLSSDDEKSLVKAINEKYLDTIDDIVEGRERGPAYLKADQTNGAVSRLIDKADDQKRKKFLEKFTTNRDGDYKFLNDDKLKPVSAEHKQQIISALNDYETELGDTKNVARPLQILDVVEKLGSGGSSYGLPRYYALVANDNPEKGPIILEVKAVLPSPLKDRNGDLNSADAGKVVANQRELNGYANPLTGAAKIDKLSFLVRELEPEKDSIATDKLTSKDELFELAEQAARVLARGHGQSSEQAEAISDWVGNDDKKMTKRLTDFARGYADQIDADYREFVAQLKE